MLPIIFSLDDVTDLAEVPGMLLLCLQHIHGRLVLVDPLRVPHAPGTRACSDLLFVNLLEFQGPLGPSF